MDYQSIIDKYYPADNEFRRVLLKHSRQVLQTVWLLMFLSSSSMIALRRPISSVFSIMHVSFSFNIFMNTQQISSDDWAESGWKVGFSDAFCRLLRANVFHIGPRPVRIHSAETLCVAHKFAMVSAPTCILLPSIIENVVSFKPRLSAILVLVKCLSIMTLFTAVKKRSSISVLLICWAICRRIIRQEE